LQDSILRPAALKPNTGSFVINHRDASR
jgi:hypothetical protein